MVRLSRFRGKGEEAMYAADPLALQRVFPYHPIT